MTIKVLGLVFLFIIRIKLLKSKLIADNVRGRYEEAFVRTIRNKLQKSNLDPRLILECKSKEDKN